MYNTVYIYYIYICIYIYIYTLLCRKACYFPKYAQWGEELIGNSKTDARSRYRKKKKKDY